MSFDRPLALLFLAALPAIVAAYVLLRRRRPRYVVSFPNVDVLRGVAPRTSPSARAPDGRARRRRPRPPLRQRRAPASSAHGPRRERNGRPRRRHLALDALARRRADAARRGQASHRSRSSTAFPTSCAWGSSTFAGDVTVAASPTHDRERLRRSVAAINRFQSGGGTAIGDALARAVELAREEFAEPGKATTTGAISGGEGAVTILVPLGRAPEPRSDPGRGRCGAGGRRRDPGLHGGARHRPAGRGGCRAGRLLRLQPRARPGDAPAISRTTGGDYFAARSAGALPGRL